MHGEVGQTQFLPKTVLEYGTGGSLETPAGALNSTANFLHAHGWRAGAGYQPGEANFAAISGMERRFCLPARHCNHRSANRWPLAANLNHSSDCKWAKGELGRSLCV